MTEESLTCCLDPGCVRPAWATLRAIVPSPEGPIRYFEVWCFEHPRTHYYVVPDSYMNTATAPEPQTTTDRKED